MQDFITTRETEEETLNSVFRGRCVGESWRKCRCLSIATAMRTAMQPAPRTCDHEDGGLHYTAHMGSDQIIFIISLQHHSVTIFHYHRRIKLQKAAPIHCGPLSESLLVDNLIDCTVGNRFKDLIRAAFCPTTPSFAAGLSPMMEPNAEALPVELSSHRSIVDSERSVRGTSMKVGKGIMGEGGCFSFDKGQRSCSSRAAEVGSGLRIDDVRSRLRGGGSGGGEGERFLGGGCRE